MWDYAKSHWHVSKRNLFIVFHFFCKNNIVKNAFHKVIIYSVKEKWNELFFETKIHWSSLCLCGFVHQPNFKVIQKILNQYMEVITIELTSSETKYATQYYLYVEFKPHFWTVESMNTILYRIRAIEKDNQNL